MVRLKGTCRQIQFKAGFQSKIHAPRLYSSFQINNSNKGKDYPTNEYI